MDPSKKNLGSDLSAVVTLNLRAIVDATARLFNLATFNILHHPQPQPICP
jgi:hypothetical protein